MPIFLVKITEYFLYIWKYHRNTKVEHATHIYILKQEPTYYLLHFYKEKYVNKTEKRLTCDIQENKFI